MEAIWLASFLVLFCLELEGADARDKTSQAISRQRRFSVPSTPTEIANPIICLELGEFGLFNMKLNTTNRSMSHFPKYARRHLYNTNPYFDDWQFAQLPLNITQTNGTFMNFVFKFDENGTYVFRDSQNADWIQIFKVLPINSTCPAGTPRVSTMTSENLLAAGVCTLPCNEPPVCPRRGYHCPNGVGSDTNCTYPTYCPSGNLQPLMCPLGYRAVNHTGIRYKMSESCQVCPEGTYGNHPQRLSCTECPAGNYCPKGSASYHQCPLGLTCPKGSAGPYPCPAGSYGNRTNATSPVDCFPCPNNTFNTRLGQTACRPCGSNATAGRGQAKCTCIGIHRRFQESNGSCVCNGGYVFYNNNPQSGNKDCQPEVDDQCGADEVLEASMRECVDPSTYNCTITSRCGGSGTFSSTYGMCICDYNLESDDVCDATCLKDKPKMTIRRNEDGKLEIIAADPTDGIKLTRVLGDEIGLLDFDSADEIHFESINYDDMGAGAPIFTDLSEAATVLDPWDSATSSRKRAIRDLSEEELEGIWSIW